jgi:hypothetical protein
MRFTIARPVRRHLAGFTLYPGTALHAAEKASSRVILSEAKDLLFICFPSSAES